MYTWFEIFLQCLASVLIGGSTFCRSWDRRHMHIASWLSMSGGLTFTIYSILTQQWGLLPLNVYTFLMGIRAVHTWSQIRKRKQKR